MFLIDRRSSFPKLFGCALQSGVFVLFGGKCCLFNFRTKRNNFNVWIVHKSQIKVGKRLLIRKLFKFGAAISLEHQNSKLINFKRLFIRIVQVSTEKITNVRHSSNKWRWISGWWSFFFDFKKSFGFAKTTFTKINQIKYILLRVKTRWSKTLQRRTN